jgi:hypothetical protein
MELWRADAHEGVHALMVLVPQDEHGKAYIREATASDLILLRQSALLAAAHIAQGAPLQSTLPSAFWHSVATGFVAFLDETLDRLATGKVEIEASKTPGAFRFKISPALFGNKPLGEIHGSWRNKCLSLEAGSSHEPPLQAWPRKENGDLLETLSISFETNNLQNLKKLRASLTQRDQRFLQLLLKALPDLARNHGAPSVHKGASAIASLNECDKAAVLIASNSKRLLPLRKLLNR